MLLLGSKFGRNFDETSTHTMYTHFKLRPNCDPSRNTYLKLRPNCDPPETHISTKLSLPSSTCFESRLSRATAFLAYSWCVSFFHARIWPQGALCADFCEARRQAAVSAQELLSSHKALHFCERFHVSLLHALSRGRLFVRTCAHVLCTIPV